MPFVQYVQIENFIFQVSLIVGKPSYYISVLYGAEENTIGFCKHTHTHTQPSGTVRALTRIQVLGQVLALLLPPPEQREWGVWCLGLSLTVRSVNISS